MPACAHVREWIGRRNRSSGAGPGLGLVREQRLIRTWSSSALFVKVFCTGVCGRRWEGRSAERRARKCQVGV